jgi:hypothetical protein
MILKQFGASGKLSIFVQIVYIVYNIYLSVAWSVLDKKGMKQI